MKGGDKLSRPKIYTSYFANLKNIPSNIEPIAISRFTMDFYEGRHEPNLAPSSSLLKRYKDGEVNSVMFRKEYLSELCNREGVNELIQSFTEKEYVLLCYEGRGKFCHRHILGEVLQEMGFDVEEI